MRLVIASDIHGAADRCARLMEAIEEIQRSSVETLICADKAQFDASIIIHIDTNLTAKVEYQVGVIPQA